MDTSAPRQAAAAATGLAEDQIGQVYLELQRLRRQGLLIDVDVRGTTMFTRRATLTDLGIPRTSMRGKTITPGQKFMIPRHVHGRLQSLAQRLRATLDKYAQDVTGFRPYRYLHYASYDAFTARWDELIAEWDELREYLLAHLDEWRDDYVAAEADRAGEAWDAIMAANGDAALALEIDDSLVAFETRDEFIEWMIRRAAPLFPTAEAVEANLVADYKTAVLTSVADIDAEIARDEAAQRRAAEERAARVAADEAARVARSEADLKMAAIRQAELEHARQQLATVVSPFEELFTNLRAWAFTEASEMADSIRRNGFFNPQVARRLRGFIELFEMKDATDDVDLAALLDELRRRAEATPRQTGRAGKAPADAEALENLTTALSDVVEATRESAQRAAERGRRLRGFAAQGLVRKVK